MDLMPINGVMVLNVSSRITSVGLKYAVIFGILAVLMLLTIVWGLLMNYFKGKDLFIATAALCVSVCFVIFCASEREPIYQITISDEAKATEVLEHYEILKIDGSIITVRERMKDKAHE